MSNPLLEIKDLHVSVNGIKIISGFNLLMHEGERIVVKGNSGSGKTTLLNVLLGFAVPDSGDVILEGKSLKEHIFWFRKKIAWLPQSIHIDMPVKDYIMLPYTLKSNANMKYGHDRTLSMITEFGLDENILTKSMADLSGGEKQRIALISILLPGKSLFLLDEPVSALDQESKKKVTDFLFVKNHFSILSNSHDDSWLALCDRLIHIEQNGLNN
ncbi:MAG: ATP-binding cassette domain-containing protein [Bacteroidota bacterium]